MCPLYSWMADGHVGGIGMMFGMLLWDLIGLAILAFLAAAIVRLFIGRPTTFLGALSTRQPDAKSILDERYARGEIAEEEYERRRQTLTTR